EPCATHPCRPSFPTRRSSDLFEKLVTIGMRGDGDEAMSEETNVALLQRIVADQRTLLREIMGREPSEIPQVWALYKEVQEYYERSEEHTSELQSRENLVCRLL